MPLTAFQSHVLSILARNRSEASHFAGSLVLHASPDSARFSHDFDIFHELAAEVAAASDRDVETLERVGIVVEKLSRYDEWQRESTFRRARVREGNETLEIDWAADSSFRFFPVERDPLLGWRLHLFDIATNKALALASRTETRDYIDIVGLHQTYPLAAICWAACGKDPGYSPLSLLKMMRRFARIDPAELDKMKARVVDPVALKTEWVRISDEAESQIQMLADGHPDVPIGVAFVDASGRPRWIDDDPALRIHPPSVRGCWPLVHGVHD